MINLEKIASLLLPGMLLVGACDKNPAPGTGAAVGTLAPDLTLPDETGASVSVAALRGKQSVLLAFYPRDFTGG